MNDTYLAHHGIIGQKWGVRRYQNRDGSLTSAGKRRYNVDMNASIEKKKQQNKSLPTQKTNIIKNILMNRLTNL